MKKPLILILLSSICMSAPAGAKAKFTCKKPYQYISCGDIEKPKREFFCWKGKLNIEKKSKICSKPRFKKKAKA